MLTLEYQWPVGRGMGFTGDVTVDPSVSLTGAQVDFVVKNRQSDADTDQVYKQSTTSTGVSISGQVITFSVAEATAGLQTGNAAWSTLTRTDYDYRVDIILSGSTDPDYRLQGPLPILYANGALRTEVGGAQTGLTLTFDDGVTLRLNAEAKNNYTATSDPTATDDASEGYGVGSRWVNTSTGQAFICQDPTTDAAQWRTTTTFLFHEKNYPSIQATITAAQASAVHLLGGAVVYLDEERYNQTTPLTVTGDAITLVGGGSGVTIIQDQTGAANSLLTVALSDPDDGFIDKFEMHGIHLIAGVEKTGGALLNMIKVQRSVIDNCDFTGGFRCIRMQGCNNMMITRNEFHTGQHFPAFSDQSALILIENYTDTGPPNTVHKPVGNWITHNQMRTDEDNQPSFVEFGILATDTDGLYIVNNHIGFAREAIALIPGATDINLKTFIIANNYIDGDRRQSDIGINLKALGGHTGEYERFTITGNELSGFNNKAILIQADAIEGTLVGNTFFNNAEGVTFAGASTEWSVVGNTFTSSDTYDLRFLSGNAFSKSVVSSNVFGTPDGVQSVAFAGSETAFAFTNNVLANGVGGTPGGKSIYFRDNVDTTGVLVSALQTENFGTTVVAPNVSGQGPITHGLMAAPASFVCSMVGDTPYAVDVITLGASSVTVRIKDPATNADVTTGSYTVAWNARV